MPYRVLFVCLGNICRSPSAEGIMNHLVAQAGLNDAVVCDSAGTSNYHVGAPPDRRMQLAAQAKGIELTGRSRQFEPDDFQQFDLILAMDKANYADILALDLQQQYINKIKLLCDFTTQFPDSEVPDPYYGGRDGFKYVIELLLDACNGLFTELVQTQQISLSP